MSECVTPSDGSRSADTHLQPPTDELFLFFGGGNKSQSEVPIATATSIEEQIIAGD